VAEEPLKLPHLYLRSNGKEEPFTSVSGGGPSKGIPPQNRSPHAASLRKDLGLVKQDLERLQEEADNLEAPLGIQIAFESFPGVELAVQSLADDRQGIELLNVKTVGDTTYATIFLPEGKIVFIEKKIAAYLAEKKNKNNAPIDHQRLIDAIKSFRTATVEALWTDDPENKRPIPDGVFWWEVWLPKRKDRAAILHDFRRLAHEAEIEVSETTLTFPERTILLAKGSKEKFTQSSLLLNCISELRQAKVTASFFDDMSPIVQRDWIKEALSRLTSQHETPSTPFITLLDTGVNHGHPLLAPFIGQDDTFAVNPVWTKDDEHRHGTEMAGIALWGDLVDVMESDQPVEIVHRLESSKVLRQPGDNEGKHLGAITAMGISYPELEYPHRKRTFVMAVSATDDRDHGRPSAWSAEIDALSSDSLNDNQTPRLILLAAGTADGRGPYPDSNVLSPIHDPGQAYNGLTVGAYTEKTVIDGEEGKGSYTPVAPHGGLSPYSCTSHAWTQQAAPVKPEIVFEGGNAGFDGNNTLALSSLSLLTTSKKPHNRPLTVTWGTSPAVALAGRFSSILRAYHPELWPETIRALMVHSATWTDRMRKDFGKGVSNKQQAKALTKWVGYGVPNLEKALWSVQNSLTLVIEDELQPFEREKGKQPRTKEMHLHDLPWPKEALQALGAGTVTMTVTLSYFVEPNPSSRMVASKYRYESHGLRFEVKRAQESEMNFRQRINRVAREEDERVVIETEDPNWTFGTQFRTRGSIHKDVWTGSAADLAERGQIAVFPAIGWWRTRTKEERIDKKTRYALIVSIETENVGVDIYSATKLAYETAIAAQTQTAIHT
jgi:hypothetical protein